MVKIVTMQSFLDDIEFPDEVIANITRDILVTEGIMVYQLGKCITDSDLEEIGIPEAHEEF
jgi:uncharacterized Fe-S cluster-containing MiaB family protein